MIQKISIVEWTRGDGMARNIREGVDELGYQTTCYHPGESIPTNVDLLFSFGPYGSITNIYKQLQVLPQTKRPIFIHWDTEGMPSFKLPSWWLNSLSGLRSLFGRIIETENPRMQKLVGIKVFTSLNRKLNRYRYFGDYHYGYKQGMLNHFFEYSIIYAQAHQRCGLPAKYAPWGTAKNEYADMDLERDIDVLWMGKRRTGRRNNLVDIIRKNIEKYGLKMLVVDGVEHPYIFGEERNRILNRAKMTLNLLPAWDFNNFPFRFHLAAGNRSLVVSEPLLPHNPEYVPNKHYAVSSIDQICDTIRYYGDHESERAALCENAYHLVTNEMTFTNSVDRILQSL